ncbi:anhydro-N-acetylmuramic acid kinase [Aestuariibaculum suncheonense]|uniref:Anhydro-N-acetylmuramic acid kinase n=1 Tax=Aestuariibaculum suncheonense TaxID=1028745 RepID=A0A8J6UFG9_9FLAO|nr:anhydro-N-acetylmuramic acid kinase [Aestuariibaculum suncheonense]MBD0834254.1 anhydro-N-acetylmuramic acid kinase [Aestuariibaculum suncheonense]
MIKNKYNIVGVMSGTSLDGIDLVYVSFEKKEHWDFNIIHAETVAYSEECVETLRGLVGCTLEDLKVIDVEYTNFQAEVIKSFISKYNLNDIDAVCSHGHTALHQPEKGLTYQIGNLPKIAELIGERVVCDFRVQDVEYGGQGAPLVPIGDKLLFADYDFCLNLGGFANISTDIDGNRIAYDICPVNIVLNHYVKPLGLDYDRGGEIAGTGNINADLLNQLNALEFYKSPYPKSLGLEWVRTNILPLVDDFKLEINDVLCTFVEHIATQLAAEINKKEQASVYITGGGVYNTYLIERLKTYTRNTIIIPENSIVEFKEALIFGFLGVLKLRDEINCLQSVTGANKDHSSGKIYLP